MNLEILGSVSRWVGEDEAQSGREEGPVAILCMGRVGVGAHGAVMLAGQMVWFLTMNTGQDDSSAAAQCENRGTGDGAHALRTWVWV